ncbi:ABC transporter substrate-binding protein [Clostridium zeae]|uniref:ABC transporter substrate-binding protein n=1 Tax=Clostridium zeae TaxID=2759022 RepID=A0ABQ1EG48_9CLOT|nr:peptide-binding protein [Clostridium zeae]GFZ33784.1 ABC transporter substrate-binding protein [Clostridium zeae]
MKKRGLYIITTLILIISVVLTGCKPQEAEKDKTTTASAKSGGTLRYAIWSSPKGVFNPSLYDDIYDDKVNSLVYQSLLNLDKNYNYIPSLADKYEVSKDNLTITFYLNKKAKWHDGQAVTAEDVAFTYTTIADPAYTGPRFGQIDKIVGAKDYKDKKASSVSGIKVIDDHTISFTFSEIFAPALSTFAARGILPKHIWEKIPVAEWAKSEQLKTPIGSGPFKLTKFVPDQYAELEKYKDYNLGEPKLDKVILKVTNQETAQSELIKGDIDLAMLSSLKQKDLDAYKTAGIKVSEFAGSGYQYMGFNLRKQIFQDKKVRQAITYGINRSGIVNNLLEGHGKIVNTPILETNWAYPDKGVLNEYAYNVDKAKELLKEAGFVEKDGVLYKDGKPFEITLKYPLGNKVREQSAPIIQQNLKDLGIKVNLVSMEFATLQKQVRDDQDFDVYLMGWSLDPEPDSKTMWHSSVAKKGGWNMVGFINDKNDQLLDDGRKVLDKEQRKKIYSEWAKLMNEEVPAVFLYNQNDGRAYSSKLKGYDPFTFVEYSNVQNWYIEQ